MAIGRNGMPDVDIAIVGAGAAGIGAACAARQAGLTAAVLEAGSRIGGRAFTDFASFGAPFDHGCFLLHSASENPLAALAARLGIRTRRGFIRRMRLFRNGAWADDDEAAALQAYFTASMAAADAAGEAGRDAPIAEILDNADPRYPLFAHRCACFAGVDPEDASTRDWADYRDTRENWPVRDGYGALIARLAEGVKATLDAPVTRIDWGADPIRLESPAGTLRARRCIVTASVGVLRDEAIRFTPALPAAKLAALDAIVMGKADKIAIGFPPGALPDCDDDYLLFDKGTRETVGFRIRPFGFDYASGYVAGRFADALAEAGPAAAAGFALGLLREAYGDGLARRATASLATSWSTQRWIRGGYSATRPGEAHRRADLAAPLDGRLFFAGEATHPHFYTTAHGAWMSGVDAVAAIAGRPIDPVGVADAPAAGPA